MAGEALAFLHRHNRLALSALFLIGLAAVAGLTLRLVA